VTHALTADHTAAVTGVFQEPVLANVILAGLVRSVSIHQEAPVMAMEPQTHSAPAPVIQAGQAPRVPVVLQTTTHLVSAMLSARQLCHVRVMAVVPLMVHVIATLDSLALAVTLVILPIATTGTQLASIAMRETTHVEMACVTRTLAHASAAQLHFVAHNAISAAQAGIPSMAHALNVLEAGKLPVVDLAPVIALACVIVTLAIPELTVKTL